MKDALTVIIGKSTRIVAKFRGGGSALPGLIVEKINPDFLRKKLSSLPHGVVVISGTNGKTTTTKILTEILQAQGLKVFTNKSGSNFVRGVLASLLAEISWRGKMKADIAVIELDEAHAQHFISQIKPRYNLLLNVMRDQLDRFGEVDYTAKLLRQIGEATEKTVLTNANDPLLSADDFARNIGDLRFFGFNQKLEKFFPADIDDQAPNKMNHAKKPLIAQLESFSQNQAELLISGRQINFQPKINGAHNLLNLTAACGMLDVVFRSENLPIDQEKLVKALAQIQPAFGRGEIIDLGDKQIEILLVKNPAGFRANLESCQLENADVMIAINDNHADGRDMSWLWDVDFSRLAAARIVSISGIRAHDMALRLLHDELDFDESIINPEIEDALKTLINSPQKHKKIFTTYTAMLKIRQQLSKITKIKEAL